jgi:hypothetical protein
MTADCRRCDWRPGEGVSLAEHAAESGHPLCLVCHRSLASDRPQTCLACLADIRRELGSIVDLYALLPGFMVGLAYGEPGKPRSDGGASDAALPGGDFLVLLAGGSRGMAHVWDDESVEVAGDPKSVAFELGRWEDDWRLTRGEPAAEVEGTVSSAVAYLMPRMGWAADQHPAFDEFAADIRRLLSRLRTATATDDRPETGAPCFDCHATLVRVWTKDGLSDDWRCPRCGATYDSARYFLAVRAEMEHRRALEEWVPLQEAVDASLRPARTLRTWIARGQVAAACRLADRKLLVWWPHVHRRTFTTERRAPRRSA